MSEVLPQVTSSSFKRLEIIEEEEKTPGAFLC